MLKKGMTLIEIVIVVMIVAGLMTLAAIGFGVIGQSDVSSESLRLSSAIRYTFTSAATTNTTLQMKLDFEAQTFLVEKLDVHGGLSEDALRGTTFQAVRSGDDERKIRDSRASLLDKEDSKFGSVTRTPVDDMFISGDDAKLDDGVYFIGLMTSHHDEIQTDGVGTINFFSNGFVERSVIYLGDEAAREGREGGIVYTVSVNPLTGQSTVEPGRVEISSSFFEEEEDD